MKFISYCFFLMVCLAGAVSAQVKTNPPKKTSTNLTDNKGVRIGLWWITTPERMGEDAFTEFGHYDNGSKTGRWYKMDGENNLISIESYKNNVLNGESKYFEKGKLTCIGHYRGINESNKFDTIVVVNPQNGYELIKALPAENATQRHGSWKYYDPQTGKLVREEEYQVDNLIYHKDYIIAGIDSMAYQNYIKKLPHNRQVKTKPSKSLSYLNN